MRPMTLIPVALAIVLAACASSGGDRVAREVPPVRWYGDVFVGGEDEAGEPVVATLSTTRLTSDRVRSTVTLRGKLPGGTYPWHIHVGRCADGSNGPILGNPDDYAMLTPDADGFHTATANLDIGLDPATSYYINVHNAEAVSPMTTIVACGELEREGG